MAGGLSLDHPWAFTFGIMGNIISFMVYLAPLPTFYRVYKEKSTQGFQSVPYVVALFSAALWVFYALLKTDACLLITINSVGCIIETVYILIYLIYAPNKAKMFTVKLVVLVNVVVYGLIVLLTLFSTKGPKRVVLLGWICMSFSVSVFVAPLSIIRLVLRTKSVEFMPFFLSFFLTLSAVVWFGYGLLTKDMYVALPNVLGFIFGVLQMALYIAYKDRKVKVIAEHKLNSEHTATITKINGHRQENNDVKTVESISNEKEKEEERAAAAHRLVLEHTVTITKIMESEKENEQEEKAEATGEMIDVNDNNTINKEAVTIDVRV